ncbi:sulfite exporter TauE/SafE family protein [Neisseria meningitidis]|uniref:sulfite exporter TauE/SafE family protein n=1 Tax=Neisseria meningitidis TaxID=487 RepID=UPI001EFCE972|nr:TSUP family transporter [Neisseria meningitidis]
MEQLFIPGSIIADYFYLGLFLLVAASLIAGYVDAIAGGAGLILIPAFLMVGLPPQVALAQEKLVSTIGTVAAIKNFMKSSSIVWRIVPVGIVAALIGAFVGAKVILILPVETINYIILAFLPIGLLATLFKGVLLKKGDERGEIKNLPSPSF